MRELITKSFEYSLFTKYKIAAITRLIITTAGTTNTKAIETLGSGSFCFTQNQMIVKSIIVNNNNLRNNFIVYFLCRSQPDA